MRVGKACEKRVYVTATDKRAGRSKSVTVYDATPEEVIAILSEAVTRKSRASRKRQTV